MTALIFDFDGLMIDSERVIAEAILKILDGLGASLSLETIGHLFGSTEADPLWDQLLRDLGVGVTIAEIDAQLMDVLPPRIDALPLLPGVGDLIEAAHADGWRLGLATGQTRRRLDQHLDRLGLSAAFHAIVTASEVPRGKPAPDIYLAVAGLLEEEPARCHVVEDSLPGCEAAIAAGMTVIVCPSAVSASCGFPDGVRRIESLASVTVSNGSLLSVA